MILYAKFLMVFPGIFFVLLLAADYSLLSKKDISFTLPVSGFTLVFLSYILSWTGLFPHIRDIINGIILLFTAYAGFVFLRSKDRKQRLKTVLNPGLAGYLILCVIALRVSRARFCQWDEFSHWGTAVKDMFYSGRLGIYPDSVSTYKTYPPGAALWEYYFVSCFKEWTDWPVIFAYNLLLIQWMMPLSGFLRSRKIEGKRWLQAGKNVLLTVIFVIIVYLVPYIYYSPFEGIPWRCIYIDRALAIGFAWMLFMHFGTPPDRKDAFYYCSFALGAGLQCLLKGTGVLFVLLALLMIIPDVILTAGKGKKTLLVRYGTTCIFPVLMILSWNTGLRIMNVSRVWDMDALSLSSIKNLLSGREEPWRYELISYFPVFLKRLSLQYYNGSIILTLTAFPLFWAAGPGLVSALNGRKDPDIDKRNLLIASAALLEFVIYEAVILLTELYVLTQEEAMRMSSGQRYSVDLVLGMSCFILFYVISYLFSGTESGRQNRYYFLLVLLFLICSVPVEKAVKHLTDPAREAADSYADTNFYRYAGIEEEIGTFLSPDDSCYILSEDNTYGHFVLRKQFVPIRTNSKALAPDTENPCEDFLKEILFNGYGHVFVDKVSDEFNNTCKGVFEDQTVSEFTLYRVNLQDGLELERVADLKSRYTDFGIGE